MLSALSNLDSPRCRVGSQISKAGRVDRSADYIPLLLENADYILPSRTFSLFRLKVGGRAYRYQHHPGYYAKREAWLMTHYGLSVRHTAPLLSRTQREIETIEECIHGIVDGLLLFDQDLFKGTGRKTVRYIVRNILIRGTYSVGDVVKFWKEFVTYLYNKGADIRPRLPVPCKENFFWKALQSNVYIVRLLKGDIDRALLTRYAHLSSTRQLPMGDKKVEIKALKTFYESIEEPYEEDPKFLTEITQVASFVAQKCTRLSPHTYSVWPHVSLNSGGSFYETVKDGGRGKEIRDALDKWLPFRPKVDECIPTPFGNLTCPAGRERWRHWCREVVYDHYPDLPFGEVITEEEFSGQHLYYQGFDEAIGCQILVCAWLDYWEWKSYGDPIPTRVLTIPESGYKSRIVTTGPYWTVVLPQSLAHVVKPMLGTHPSARSSMLWGDQAWQSLYLMSGKSYPKGFSVLSSDLKEATDHIPKVVVKALLEGFFLGSRLKTNLFPSCLDIIMMDRFFSSWDGQYSIRQTRGAMMGEPLTKATLTILNLVVEEWAIRSYSRCLRQAEFLSPPWRTYHVGGDDHLAVGPPLYLHLITLAHLKCGSKISEGKHGTSKRFVKYTEKVLDISVLFQGTTFNVEKINSSLDEYLKSPFVDSVKMRLLSPGSKAFDEVSERNVAIGKGISLGRTLDWLNPEFFPWKVRRMVRDRFFQRMGALLPDRSSGVYWQLCMPTWWGGMGLGYYTSDEDLIQLYRGVPEVTKTIMEDYQRTWDTHTSGVDDLQAFLKNRSYRGYKLPETEVAVMKQHLEDIIRKHMPKATWPEIKRMFDPEGKDSAVMITSKAYQEGWWSEWEIISQLLRPLLFKEVLLGKEKPSPYTTVPLKRRYAELWDKYYTGPSSLSFENFKELLRMRPVPYYYKVGYPEEHQFLSDRGYLFKSVLDDALHGMPVLSTRYPYG